MEKLELKHLVGYLPYNSPVSVLGKKGILSLRVLNHYPIDCISPILRPLYDLTKEIEVNVEKFVPIEWFEKNINKTISFYNPSNIYMPIQIDVVTENYSQTIDLFDGYLTVQKLYEWHFDIHGLIEKGLAIDINTL